MMGVVKEVMTGHVRAEPVSRLPLRPRPPEDRAWVSSIRRRVLHLRGRAEHGASGSKSRASSKLQEWLLPSPGTLQQGHLCPHAAHCPSTPSHHYVSQPPAAPRAAGTHHLEPRPWRRLQTPSAAGEGRSKGPGRASKEVPRDRGEQGSWKGPTFPARLEWEGFPLPCPSIPPPH